MIAIVGVIITIVGAVVTHIIASVWWASRISTTLQFVQLALTELRDQKALAFTKEDAARHATFVKEQLDALWKRTDENRDRSEALEKDLAGVKGRAA